MALARAIEIGPQGFYEVYEAVDRPGCLSHMPPLQRQALASVVQTLLDVVLFQTYLRFLA